MKKKTTSVSPTKPEENTSEVQASRRDFIKKYGKLGAVTPVAVTLLMSPHTSKAQTSGGNNGNGQGNGFGNGNGNGRGNGNGFERGTGGG